MIILGLNVFHADTAACLVVDGQIVAASEEERFTRIKHFTGFPYNSINYCLEYAKISLNDVDYITVNYDLRYNLLERFKYLFSNLGSTNLIDKIINLFNKKSLSNLFVDYFDIDCQKKIKFIPHHKSHIASSFYTSGFNNAVGLSIDGTGDFSSMEISECNKNNINIFEKNLYPHSLGIMYQAITQFIGFKKYGDEYKVMALAAYGEPKFIKEFEEIVKFEPPFNFKLNLEYFVHQKKFSFKESFSDEPIFENLYSKKMENLFGAARKYNEPLTKHHMDIATSLQYKFEDIILKIVDNLYLENRSENLCLSGGCMFNSVLNGKIKKKIKFKNIFLHPNVGDAGGSIGSALYFLSNKSETHKPNLFTNNFLGPSYSDLDVKNSIDNNFDILKKFRIVKYEKFDEIIEIAAKILKEKKIIGWFQDRMEWGPRALGNRSILVNAAVKNAQDVLNTKIKLREKFRPFAASVLENRASEYFDTIGNDYPNMNFVFQAKENTKLKFPSIVHVDGTSRIQTVNSTNNFKFYNLIKKFESLTGNPLLLNTSLNIDEPICESPDDVIKSFAITNIDCLILQNYVLEKVNS